MDIVFNSRDRKEGVGYVILAHRRIDALVNSYFKVITMGRMTVRVVCASVDIVRYPRYSCNKQIL